MRSQQTEGQPSKRAQYRISLTEGGDYFGEITAKNLLVFINIRKDLDEVTTDRGAAIKESTVLDFINSVGEGFWYGHRQRDTIINSTVLVFINIFKDFEKVTYRGKPTLRDTVLVFINSINWISLTMEGEGNFSPNMQ